MTQRARERVLRRYARLRRPDDLEWLVISYGPLARALARRYVASREDLDQAACEGLIKAIRRFEPERGAAFASFAVPTILGELRRYVRDTAWPAHVPRALQERVRDVRAAGDAFAAVHGRNPTTPELVRMLGCTEEEVVEALGATSSLSVVPLHASAPVAAEEPGFEQVECLAAIEEALPALTSAEKRVLRLHFADDLTQREIARRLGITRAAVARDLGAAVARLRSAAREAA